ncbi:hypothetical protein [Nostoc commune]|uniref:hypothetical protein n=1 Tax=Nostoc commune TaxID=1178 RepID=UPI0020735683|nr:hypothetical protein [Nostoc commune]
MTNEKRRDSISYLLAEFCIKNYFLFRKLLTTLTHYINKGSFLAVDVILNLV